MMKKLTAILLALLMLTLPCLAQAETSVRMRWSVTTRTGPGYKYTIPGTFLSTGSYVTAHTKVWDPTWQEYWVQIDFQLYNGLKYRSYVTADNIDGNLNDLPNERALESCRVINTCWSYAGPGTDYVCWSDRVYSNTYATLYEVEDGWGLIDCQDGNSSDWERVWVDLDNLSVRSRYSDWEDTYNNYANPKPGDGTQGNNPTPKGPRPSPNGERYVGDVCIIISTTGHVRSGPGVEYGQVGYVYDGHAYYVHDTDRASNGRLWFKIRMDNGSYGWISSGITMVNGVIP